VVAEGSSRVREGAKPERERGECQTADAALARAALADASG
jgi:hypothetical protein